MVLDVLSAEKTAAGAHAFAQLWSLLGRRLDTELRPETEALHLVSVYYGESALLL